MSEPLSETGNETGNETGDGRGPVEPEFTEMDAAEASLRPQTLDAFIGQRLLRENLRVFVDAATARGEPLDHVLFHGVLRDRSDHSLPNIRRSIMSKPRHMNGRFHVGHRFVRLVVIVAIGGSKTIKAKRLLPIIADWNRNAVRRIGVNGVRHAHYIATRISTSVRQICWV